MQTRARIPQPTMAGLFTMVFMLGGWRSGLQRLSDNSFFWHLRTGRAILDDWVPRSDPYSFTAEGTRWVSQSWLAEALYGAIDRSVGSFGLRLLGATTGALVAGLTYRLALRLCRDRLIAAGLTLASIGASFTLWSERPLFLGLLALVCLVWIVEVPDSFIGRRPMVSLPILMWLWANVHGTFALGFVYLGLHVAGRWLDGAPPWQGRERVVTQAAVLAFVLCLVNPYGPALLVFPVELLARGEILRRVTEWRSPDFRTIQGLTFAAWLAVLVSCVALGRHRLSRRDVLVAVPFTLLALWAQRNIAIGPLVGLPVVARAVSVREGRSESRAPMQQVMAAFVLALWLLWTVQAAAQPSFDFRIYPVKAMEYVDSHGLLGRRLMTDDAWGGYLILEWPAQKVFVDDRYDMYPVEITRDFIRFSDADRRWREILDKYEIDVVVWRQDQPVVRLLDTDGSWERLYRDKTAVVYVRRPSGNGG